MTKKTPTPTAQHMQKLADLMDARPEGVNLRQVQNTLSVSPTLAKAALIEIGAAEVEGKWVFEPEQDDATLEEIGSFVSQPKVDWSKAPEGATHYAAKYSQYYKRTGHGVMLWDADEWVRLVEFTTTDLDNMGAIPRPTSTATFVDLPTIVGIDWAQNMTAPAEPEPVTKSDFALALEAERQRVFDAVAIGGTVERLAELTGLHVDDVQQHLDALIVDGAIYQKPIIVAMSYGVMG